MDTKFNLTSSTLTSVTELVGHRPAKLKAAGSVLHQGTCLGCEFGPWSDE